MLSEKDHHHKQLRRRRIVFFPGILFACRRMDWLGSGQTDYSLVYAEEALRDGLKAPTYAYDFSEQAEIMGFLVADNEFTQRNIYGLMADVLYEASFFGFNEEFRDGALRDISRTIKNLDKWKTIPSSGLRMMIQTCNYTEPEEEDSEERMLRNDAEMAVMKYNEYCRDKGLETIVLLLRQCPYEPANPQSVTDA